MRCTAVQRVSKVVFDWIFEIRVGKLMHITCVFNAKSTRTNRWAVVYRGYDVYGVVQQMALWGALWGTCLINYFELDKWFRKTEVA